MIQLLRYCDFVDVTDEDEMGDGCCRAGDLPWEVVEEPSIGALFRGLRDRFGRCTGKVYRDVLNGDPLEVGWVFRKRGDEWCGEDRVIDTWVTLSADLQSAAKILKEGR